jgi:hypothetical protein
MCFNSQTSINAFIISIISSIILLFYSFLEKNKDKAQIDLISSVLILLIGSMQLLEYYMWSDQKCTTEGYNRLASLLVLPLLYSQPVITFMLSLYLAYPKLNTLVSNNPGFLLLSFVIITAFTMVLIKNTQLLIKADKLKKIENNVLPLCSRPDNRTKRLIWSPMKYLFEMQPKQSFLFLFFYFFLIYLCSFLIPSLWKIFPVRAIVLPITFIAAAIYSIIYGNKGSSIGILSDIFDSTWCFLAIGFGIVSVLHI